MRQTVRYALTDPTGNRTVLVETPVPEPQQPEIAAYLMRLEPTAEQVGFLQTGTGHAQIALRMAGGEFCANAAMSAAAWFAEKSGAPSGTVRAQVSGADGLVAVHCAPQADGSWRTGIDMPRPQAIRRVCLDGGQTYPVVVLPGIAHVILEDEAPDEAAGARAKAMCAYLHADALGLMFLDTASRTLRPLVYVPAAGTLVWENSCGSGSSAVGAYLAHRAGAPVSVELRQPGGTLGVTAAPDGTLHLRGQSMLLYEKCVEMPTDACAQSRPTSVGE